MSEYTQVQVGTYSNKAPMLVADRMRQILELVEILVGEPITVTQGSYHDSTTASGGTHDGGGAVDVSVHGHSGTVVEEIVQTFRQLGCAAWHRLPNQGPWPEHVHAVDSGATDLSPQALWQVNEYKAGRNGLTNQQTEVGHLPLEPYVYAPGDIVEITLSKEQLDTLAKSVAEQVWNQAIEPTQFVKDVYADDLKVAPPKPRQAGDLLYNQAARLQRMEGKD